MAKKRILFFAEAVTLAHIARPLVLAQALPRDKYEIHLACDPRFDRLLPEMTLTHHPIRSIASDQFFKSLKNSKPVYDLDTLRAYAAEDLAVIGKVDPHLIVGDFRLSLAASAPKSRVTYMAITNAYWSPFAKPRFSVPEISLTRALGVETAQLIFNLIRPAAFALHSLPVNLLRRSYGLAPLGWDLRQVYTWGDYTLYADVPEFVPTFGEPDNHRFIGPILWSPTVPKPDWWEALPPDKPTIYLTFGSSGRSDLLPGVLAALADLPVTVIAATAGRSTLSHTPHNAYIAEYLPGEACVSRAQLVICNGGSPTAQQALAYGVPLLGIPTNLDQHLNMDAVVRSGAGLLLRSEMASDAAIKRAASELLKKPSYALAAQRLAGVFLKYDARRRFADLVAETLHGMPKDAGVGRLSMHG